MEDLDSEKLMYWLVFNIAVNGMFMRECRKGLSENKPVFRSLVVVEAYVIGY